MLSFHFVIGCNLVILMEKRCQFYIHNAPPPRFSRVTTHDSRLTTFPSYIFMVPIPTSRPFSTFVRPSSESLLSKPNQSIKPRGSVDGSGERMKTADRVPLCLCTSFHWLFFSLVLSSCSFVFSAVDELSIFVAQPITLQLSSGLPVENSPGSIPGEVMFCQRVHIYGLSRLQDLSKYAHSVKAVVKDARADSRGRLPNIEVCFHRNVSLGIGMCTEGVWEKLTKGLWVRSVSPYMNNLLDIRMPGPSFEVLEVSVEEELLLDRVIFLVLGIALMTLAADLSMSIMFYYSSAMAIGIILVILMILFQLQLYSTASSSFVCELFGPRI
ncbi:uncharacterized protein LOC122084553 [Macadamia integrifolia]|uniref:uncharacterized protein LOC122084553 n=1 Tax=Macadamia integrifolia TaxID=60698 RepID=UPI001C4ED79C|nr:uncharacterized protein LOC122084553 [Macadamia integrifolia]